MSMGGGMVLEALDALEREGLACWIDGGWGVDALLGRQTRDHDDLDVVVRLDQVDRVYQALAPLGFALSEDHLPTRAVRAGRGTQIDLPPVEFEACGDAWQRGAGAKGGDALYPADGFAMGTIEGRTAPCLSAALQVRHHSGYEPTDKDRVDMGLLCEAFGLEWPRPASPR